MAEVVNVYEAKTRLSSLLDRALDGEAIFIAKRNKPLAQLVPLEQGNGFVGSLKGKVWIAEDFDAIDLTDIFYGESDENPV